MDKLDKLIEDAMKGEDRVLLEDTKELGYFALGLQQFRGKLGWVTWMIMIMQSVLFLAGIWCFYEMYVTSEVLLAIKWGVVAATLLLTAINLKLSIWPQMQADRVLRELKRVELMLLNRS